MKLLHYCCDHSAAGIRTDGTVRPWPQPALAGIALSWWTDLEPPDRLGLGLTSLVLDCDRLEQSFEPTPASRGLIAPWLTWLSGQPLEVRRAGRGLHYDDTLPRHWYFAEQPIRIVQ